RLPGLPLAHPGDGDRPPPQGRTGRHGPDAARTGARGDPPPGPAAGPAPTRRPGRRRRHADGQRLTARGPTATDGAGPTAAAGSRTHGDRRRGDPPRPTARGPTAPDGAGTGPTATDGAGPHGGRRLRAAAGGCGRLTVHRLTARPGRRGPALRPPVRCAPPAPPAPPVPPSGGGRRGPCG